MGKGRGRAARGNCWPSDAVAAVAEGAALLHWHDGKQAAWHPPKQMEKGSSKEKGRRRRRDVGNVVRDQSTDAGTVASMRKDSRGREHIKRTDGDKEGRGQGLV